MKSLFEVVSEEHRKSWIVSMSFPNDAYRKLRKVIVGILPDLPEQEDGPHITVMYLGKKVNPTDREAMIEAFNGAVKLAGKPAITIGRVETFQPTESSDWKTPVVIEVVSDYLQRLNAIVVRAMNPYNTQKQFPDYRPHITIGYLNRDLTSAEKAALWNLKLPEVSLGDLKVALMIGDEVLSEDLI